MVVWQQRGTTSLLPPYLASTSVLREDLEGAEACRTHKSGSIAILEALRGPHRTAGG